LKPAVNSSLTKFGYTQVATARAAWWALRLPNYVWLAMILVAAAALSLNTIAREREEVRRAQTSYSQTESRFQQAQTENQKLKTELKSLKQNPGVAGRAVQDRLHYVRPNEIVVVPR
jgi:septal ring factor EnvC (AmiA/AmiB activator)